MPIHLIVLAPKLTWIAKFVGTQLKDPAKRAIGIDPMSKALHKGVESFLAAFEAEYERRETLSTLLEESTKDSVSAFVHEPSTLQLLATPFTGVGTFETSTLASLWKEIRLPGGTALMQLPAAFDWDSVWDEYTKSAKVIRNQMPELRDIGVAENLDQIRIANEGMRGTPPRFSVEKYRAALKQAYGTLKLSAIHTGYDPNTNDLPVALQEIYVQQNLKEAFPP